MNRFIIFKLVGYIKIKWKISQKNDHNKMPIADKYNILNITINNAKYDFCLKQYIHIHFKRITLILWNIIGIMFQSIIFIYIKKKYLFIS